jgi:hypothetical protein
MKPIRLNRSATLVIAQVLIRGQVVDSEDTQMPIAGYTVRLFDEGPDPAVAIIPARFHLNLKQTPEGEFGFFGDPEAIPLNKMQQYKWRVELSAPKYEVLKKSFQFGPLAFQPVVVEFPNSIPDDIISVRLFNAGLPVQLGKLELVKSAIS